MPSNRIGRLRLVKGLRHVCGARVALESSKTVAPQQGAGAVMEVTLTSRPWCACHDRLHQFRLALDVRCIPSLVATSVQRDMQTQAQIY